jgi:hypothetical protein
VAARLAGVGQPLQPGREPVQGGQVARRGGGQVAAHAQAFLVQADGGVEPPLAVVDLADMGEGGGQVAAGDQVAGLPGNALAGQGQGVGVALERLVQIPGGAELVTLVGQVEEPAAITARRGRRWGWRGRQLGDDLLDRRRGVRFGQGRVVNRGGRRGRRRLNARLGIHQLQRLAGGRRRRGRRIGWRRLRRRLRLRLRLRLRHGRRRGAQFRLRPRRLGGRRRRGTRLGPRAPGLQSRKGIEIVDVLNRDRRRRGSGGRPDDGPWRGRGFGPRRRRQAGRSGRGRLCGPRRRRWIGRTAEVEGPLAASRRRRMLGAVAIQRGQQHHHSRAGGQKGDHQAVVAEGAEVGLGQAAQGLRLPQRIALREQKPAHGQAEQPSPNVVFRDHQSKISKSRAKNRTAHRPSPPGPRRAGAGR